MLAAAGEAVAGGLDAYEAFGAERVIRFLRVATPREGEQRQRDGDTLRECAQSTR